MLHVRKCVVLVSYASIPPFLKVLHHQHLFLQQSPAYPSARPPIRSISYNRPESNIEPFSSGFGHLHPHGHCRSCPTEYNGRFYLHFWYFKKHEQLQLQCRVEMQPALGRWRSPWASDRITPTRPFLILLTLAYFILLPLCWREVLLAFKL